MAYYHVSSGIVSRDLGYFDVMYVYSDGTDDILLCDANNNLAAWSVKDGKVTGVIAIA